MPVQIHCKFLQSLSTSSPFTDISATVFSSVKTECSTVQQRCHCLSSLLVHIFMIRSHILFSNFHPCYQVSAVTAHFLVPQSASWNLKDLWSHSMHVIHQSQITPVFPTFVIVSSTRIFSTAFSIQPICSTDHIQNQRLQCPILHPAQVFCQ